MQKDIKESSSSKRHILISSDEEEEDLQPRSKKKDKLDVILNDVCEIKDTLADMMSLGESCKVPLGVKRLIQNAFKCSICHCVPIRPPVIITKCCKTILGCETCVNTWFSGQDALVKTCPSCRAERGYNETMLLRGLDEFLTEIRKVMVPEEDEG